MSNPAAITKLRLTEAQLSALECRPEGDFRIRGHYLIVQPDTADALNDASNAEDTDAEQTSDHEMRKYARRAARSLATLYLRALRAEAP